MNIERIKLIYFSATGTTRTIVESIAQGMTAFPVDHIDLTFSRDEKESITLPSNELIIIGAPVYGGRLPAGAIERFRRLRTKNTPAVLVVVYGNREYEDALIELKNLALELGLIPLAGGAFIGEHSFSSTASPIASGRPDQRDIKQAITFGKKVEEKIACLQQAEAQTDLQVAGTFPYAAAGARPLAAVPHTSDELCTNCGTCAAACPTGAIVLTGTTPETSLELCIRCCACIKHCPEGAKSIQDENWLKIVAWLNEKCKNRKEPQFFGVEQ